MESDSRSAGRSSMPGSDLSMPALVLLVAALLIIGGHVVFGLLLSQFRYDVNYLVLSMWLVVALVSRRDWGVTGVRAVKVIGFSLAAFGFWLLLGNLRFGFPAGLVDNVANGIFYVACVLAGFGAWRLSD